jgi:hypothetical protein
LTTARRSPPGAAPVDQRTKDYIARRTADGLSNLEIVRCLKRYLAREVYYLIKNSQLGTMIT